MVINVTKHSGEIIVYIYIYIDHIYIHIYIYIHIPMNPIPLSARWYLLDVLQRPTILRHEPGARDRKIDGTGKSMLIIPS